MAEEKPDVPQEPWARRPRESGPAYKAFQKYLELGGERSLVKACEELGYRPSSVSRLKEWSKVHEWQKRVRAWDDDEARRRVEKFRLEGDKARDRWIEQAMAIQGGMAALLRELVERINSDKINLTELSDDRLLDMMREMAKPWRHAIDVERLSRGEATSRVEEDSTLRVELWRPGDEDDEDEAKR